MDELRCLHELFPHASPRPGQLAALEAIARMFRESIPVLISEVPTGAGKSALALTMARYAATLTSSERGAYILTPYNNLVQQMTDGFRAFGLASLRGRKHYGTRTSNKYEHARSCFLESPVSVTNYAYFMTARHLPPRQVLIVDESHNLEKVLLSLVGFRITPPLLLAAGVDTTPLSRPFTNESLKDWLGRSLFPALQREKSRCRDSAALRELDFIATRVAKFIDLNDSSQWIGWKDAEGALNVKPLSVATQARDLLAHGRFVLLQSATIFDFSVFQRTLGISGKVTTFSARSDFPLCNRPVICRPVGHMTKSAKKQTIPYLCAEIERIVSRFGHSKGVIHTHSYEINRAVTQYLATKHGDRVITHGNAQIEREEAITQHCKTDKPSVLVSPSITEGVDFADELARFQIVCKIPYPRWDEYSRSRHAIEPKWYDLQTASTLVQMTGRAVRSNTDFATTFVLDSNLTEFVERSESILPTWWLDAIQMET